MPEATIQVTVRVPQATYEAINNNLDRRGRPDTLRSMAAWFLEAAREKLEREEKAG